MDALLVTAQQLTASPWFYALMLAVALVDAVLPVLPSEAVIIAAGVLATGGTPDLALVVAAAATGAFLGDHLCYAIGRGLGPVLLRRAGPGSRRHRSVVAARRQLRERGGIALVAGRHIPGGRTAITVTCGLTHYPRPRFALFAAIATSLWAVTNGLIGVVGGIAFADDPLLGLVAGMTLAAGIAVVGEIARRVRRRIRARRSPDALRGPLRDAPAAPPAGHEKRPRTGLDA